MQTLSHLSDDELVALLLACTTNLRRSKVRMLVVLADIEERRIHLKAAASSMWDYCRRFLQLSHGTAYRFICVARLCKRFPFLIERIDRGEAHISTLAHIASWITPQNVEELVAETKGRSRAEIDLVLGRKFGFEPANGRMGGLAMPYDEELLQLMQRARELLSHGIPSGDRLEISKVAYRVLIAHLEKTKRAKTDKPRPAPSKATKQISRHATRTMFERDGDQCCYVDERTGARCPSRAFIQREHRDMRAHGGSNDPDNLRPMCAAHNVLLAEMALGREYVQRRVRFRQQKKA